MSLLSFLNNSSTFFSHNIKDIVPILSGFHIDKSSIDLISISLWAICFLGTSLFLFVFFSIIMMIEEWISFYLIPFGFIAIPSSENWYFSTVLENSQQFLIWKLPYSHFLLSL